MLRFLFRFLASSLLVTALDAAASGVQVLRKG
jgi:hypothetical protein